MEKKKTKISYDKLKNSLVTFLTALGVAIIADVIAKTRVVAIIIFISIFLLLLFVNVILKKYIRLTRVLAIISLVMILSIIPTTFDMFRILDLNLMNWLFQNSGNAYVSDDIVLVYLDDESAKIYDVDTDNFAASRNLHGKVLKILSECGAKSVAIDIGFPSKGGYDKNEFISMINTAKENGTSVIIGLYRTFNESTGKMEISTNDKEIAEVATGEGYLDFEGFEGKSTEIRAIKFVDEQYEIEVDEQYEIEVVTGEEKLQFAKTSLSLSAYCSQGAHFKIEDDELVIYAENPKNTKSKEFGIPRDEKGFTYIPFPKVNFKEYNYAQIIATYEKENENLEGNYDHHLILEKPLKEIFNNKFVIMAISCGEGKDDKVCLPGNRIVHGSLIHAYALSALILKNFIIEVPLKYKTLINLSAILVLFYILTVCRIKPGWKIILTSALLLGFVLFMLILFRYFLVYCSPVYVIISMTMSIIIFPVSQKIFMFKLPKDKRGGK
jgi:CHASE2 domain-containing sensor protein